MLFSLIDGARCNDWMLEGKTPAEAQEYEEDKFSTVGALVMGRRVLDVGIGPWGKNPTFHAPFRGDPSST